MDYLVPAIGGVLFSIFMNKIAVPHIKVVLFSEKMLESLKNMADIITQISLPRVEEQSPHLIHKWYKELLELREESRMVEEHLEWWNICSRSRRSKYIANLISRIEKRLKLLPLIQLDCVILKLLEILLSPPPEPKPEAKPEPAPIQPTDLISPLLTFVLLEMFRYIGRVRNFPKKLKSFKDDLVNEMKDFIRDIRNGINQIQRGNNASNWLNNASNWVDEMKDIIEEGDGINETRSPIARCRKSKQITEPISRIDAHLNKLSWINLELLFHEIERTRSHPPPPQIERPRSHPPPPQETEGSTSHPPPSQETEGCTSQPPQALQDHGVCPHYNYVPGGVCPHYVLRGFCPHYNHVPREFCPHYNYVPRGFCPHYNSVGHDPCPTM